jgi:Zn-dependent peptidase ImmA (M78 family)
MDDAEDAAANLRKAWNLDDASIDSLTTTVEDHGGVVVACEEDFDGLAGTTDSGFPVAVVSMEAPNDRRRYNLAHEIGHLLLICEGISDSAIVEQLANRFASALLVPPAVALSELGSKRRRLDFRELGLLKEKYGLSIQGWVRRAVDLNIIEDSQYKNLCVEISRNKWRQVEPFEFRGNETPSRLRQMTLRAFSEGVISAQRAEQIVPGCTEKMVPLGKSKLSAAEIRRLPREQRSALLSSAAAMAESEYATNRDLTSFEAYGEDDLYDGDVKSPER